MRALSSSCAGGPRGATILQLQPASCSCPLRSSPPTFLFFQLVSSPLPSREEMFVAAATSAPAMGMRMAAMDVHAAVEQTNAGSEKTAGALRRVLSKRSLSFLTCGAQHKRLRGAGVHAEHKCVRCSLSLAADK